MRDSRDNRFKLLMRARFDGSTRRDDDSLAVVGIEKRGIVRSHRQLVKSRQTCSLGELVRHSKPAVVLGAVGVGRQRLCRVNRTPQWESAFIDAR